MRLPPHFHFVWEGRVGYCVCVCECVFDEVVMWDNASVGILSEPVCVCVCVNELIFVWSIQPFVYGIICGDISVFVTPFLFLCICQSSVVLS